MSQHTHTQTDPAISTLYGYLKHCMSQHTHTQTDPAISTLYGYLKHRASQHAYRQTKPALSTFNSISYLKHFLTTDTYINKASDIIPLLLSQSPSVCNDAHNYVYGLLPFFVFQGISSFLLNLVAGHAHSTKHKT